MRSPLVLVTVVVVLFVSAGLAFGPLPAQAGSTQVVMLGTGTPNADPEHSGPCVAVIVNNTSYIIDCGPGLVRRAAAASAKHGIDALKAANLKTVFITHLHSDHTLGLPDILLSPWVLGRQEPLSIYGPEGTQEMADHILAAWERDIYMRLYGLEPGNSHGYKATVREIAAGRIYQDENVTVEAIPVKHGSFHHAFGFKFITPDKVIVISGDTAPCESLIEAAIGCDMLIHEVYCQATWEKRAPLWKPYHKQFHTSTVELADIAGRVKPGLLVLYHQLYWGASDQDLVDEIKAHYDGEVVSGQDLDVFE